MDPYSMKSPWESSENNGKSQAKEMAKQRAKDDAKKAFDSLLQSYQNSKKNGLEWEKNYEKIGAVRRYYYDYKMHKYITFLMILGVLSFVASFFIKLTFSLILIAPLLYIFFSKDLYLRGLFFAHSIDKEVKKEIYFHIFDKSNSKLFVLLSVVLTLGSFVSAFYTKAIFLPHYQNTFLYSLLIKKFPLFDINNELLAYSILFSFFILIIFKMVKK